MYVVIVTVCVVVLNIFLYATNILLLSMYAYIFESSALYPFLVFIYSKEFKFNK